MIDKLKEEGAMKAMWIEVFGAPDQAAKLIQRRTRRKLKALALTALLSKGSPAATEANKEGGGKSPPSSFRRGSTRTTMLRRRSLRASGER